MEVRPMSQHPTPTQRPAEPGERCTCGRPAVIVYLTERRDVGYCGRPDGGARTVPCPFCGEETTHRSPWGDPAVCPAYRVRPADRAAVVTLTPGDQAAVTLTGGLSVP